MFARSVVWGMKEIESCLATLQDEPMLRGQPTTTRESDRARTTLRELVELLRGTGLSRPSDPSGRRDDSVVQLLVAMYAEGTARLEAVSPHLPDGTVQSLRTAGHVETKHDEVYVPLRGVNTARNWPPVLRLLVKQLGEFVRRTREIVQKLHADGTGEESSELLLVRSLLARLEHLRTVLRSQLGQLQVINYSVFVDTQVDRFVADVVPSAFGVDTIEGKIP